MTQYTLRTPDGRFVTATGQSADLATAWLLPSPEVARGYADRLGTLLTVWAVETLRGTRALLWEM